MSLWINRYYLGTTRGVIRETVKQYVENQKGKERVKEGCLTLAKQQEPLNIVWSRPLPKDAKPSSVTVFSARFHGLRSQKNAIRAAALGKEGKNDQGTQNPLESHA